MSDRVNYFKGCYILIQLIVCTTYLCQCTGNINIRVILMLSSKNHIIQERRIKPAFDIAMEKVQRDVRTGIYSNFTINYVYSDKGCTGPKVLGPGVVSQIYSKNDIVALFGPPCTSSGVAVSDMASFWNIPMLSGATTGAELGNKNRHSHLTRTSPGLDGMAIFFSRVLRLFKWHRLSHVADFYTLNEYFGLVGNALQNRLLSEGYSVNKIALTDYHNMTEALVAATRRSRSK